MFWMFSDCSLPAQLFFFFFSEKRKLTVKLNVQKFCARPPFQNYCFLKVFPCVWQPLESSSIFPHFSKGLHLIILFFFKVSQHQELRVKYLVSQTYIKSEVLVVQKMCCNTHKLPFCTKMTFPDDLVKETVHKLKHSGPEVSSISFTTPQNGMFQETCVIFRHPLLTLCLLPKFPKRKLLLSGSPLIWDKMVVLDSAAAGESSIQYFWILTHLFQVHLLKERAGFASENSGLNSQFLGRCCFPSPSR